VTDLGKNSRLAKLKFWTLFAIIVFLLWWLTAWLAARWLVVSEPLERADAIVMLSGSGSFVERASYAAQLYQQGTAPKIILTNDGEQGSWSTAEQLNPFFFERARNQLLTHGVPSEAIMVLPDIVSSTHDEASLVRRDVDQYRLKSILLVTSSYHSRRVLSTFRKSFAGSGCQVGIQPVPSSMEAFSSATWWWHVKGWLNVPMEYFKLVYYWLWYR
jgi:uncharacterized SAM-binding protein YcdF (DUF218 family)